MPTDFVAKWIAFLGYTVPYWARIEESQDNEIRLFVRLHLGLLCILMIAGFIISLAVSKPNWIEEMSKLLTLGDQLPSVLQRLSLHVIQVLLLLLFLPSILGVIIRLSLQSGRMVIFWSVVTTLALFWLGQQVSWLKQDIEPTGLLILAFLPAIAAFAPYGLLVVKSPTTRRRDSLKDQSSLQAGGDDTNQT